MHQEWHKSSVLKGSYQDPKYYQSVYFITKGLSLEWGLASLYLHCKTVLLSLPWRETQGDQKGLCRSSLPGSEKPASWSNSIPQPAAECRGWISQDRTTIQSSEKPGYSYCNHEILKNKTQDTTFHVMTSGMLNRGKNFAFFGWHLCENRELGLYCLCIPSTHPTNCMRNNCFLHTQVDFILMISSHVSKFQTRNELLGTQEAEGGRILSSLRPEWATKWGLNFSPFQIV